MADLSTLTANLPSADIESKRLAAMNGNDISQELKNYLKNFKWAPNSYIDLHSPKYGVHYFDPNYLPSHLDPMTTFSLLRRGITPPNMLPTYFEDNIHEKIKDWYAHNYFRLLNSGVQHLGCELNYQRPEEFDDAKIKILIFRLSPYEVVDGSVGHYVVGEWIRTYCTEKVFIDYCCVPNDADLSKYIKAGIPTLFGSITKRPLMDFDFIGISHSPPNERMALPINLIKSGIPLFLWERLANNLPYRHRKGKKHMPAIFIAGIGAQMMESTIGDHPVYGPGMCSPFDHCLVGEGENMDLDYIESYINIVLRDGGTYEDWRQQLYDQRKHPGVYDPTRVVYEYGDKVHVETDINGKELGTTLWKQGGRIKSTYILDNEGNKVKVAGIGVQESKDLETIQPNFLKLLSETADVNNNSMLEPYLKDKSIPNV